MPLPTNVAAVTPAIPVTFVEPSPAIFPLAVISPATESAVPFSNCSESLLNLAVIAFEPAFLLANSIRPS